MSCNSTSNRPPSCSRRDRDHFHPISQPQSTHKMGTWHNLRTPWCNLHTWRWNRNGVVAREKIVCFARRWNLGDAIFWIPTVIVVSGIGGVAVTKICIVLRPCKCSDTYQAQGFDLNALTVMTNRFAPKVQVQNVEWGLECRCLFSSQWCGDVWW